MTAVLGDHEGLVCCAKTSFCMIIPCPILPTGFVTRYRNFACRLWTILLISNSHTQSFLSIWVP